jgi:FkbM family methyltransferase
MSVSLDLDWLKKQAADDASRQRLGEIKKWRDFVLANNRFTGGQNLFPVNLGKYQVWFRESGAFSSIEVYQEIFKNNDHFAVPGFSGREAGLVVDIGANEGFYTLKIKENNPECRVIAVEPNPYVFEILKKNINANRLRGVTLVNKAVSIRDGDMTMEIVKEIGAIGARSLGIVNRPWLKPEFVEQMSVPAVSPGTFFREYNIGAVDILKIDVEGMEAEILESARKLLKNVHRIVLERHSRELRDAVTALLQENRFRLVHEEDPLIEKYYGDMYFINDSFSVG